MRRCYGIYSPLALLNIKVAVVGKGNNIHRDNRSGKYEFKDPTTSFMKGTRETLEGLGQPFPDRISMTTVTFSVWFLSSFRSRYIAKARAYVVAGAIVVSS
jgi:hypothetical protein